MIRWGINNPYKPSPIVRGTVTGFDMIKGRSIKVKLDNGPVVKVGGSGNSCVLILVGRRIQLQEINSNNGKGYHVVGYLEPKSIHGVSPASSFHKERP